MHEETEEEYLAWRREAYLASRAGFKLVRQQAKNRYTNVELYLEDLGVMIATSRDETLKQRYINFLADAVTYWQKTPEYQSSKATYTRC